MNKKVKKIFAAGLTAALAMSVLAGCGNSSGDGSADGGSAEILRLRSSPEKTVPAREARLSNSSESKKRMRTAIKWIIPSGLRKSQTALLS